MKHITTATLLVAKYTSIHTLVSVLGFAD